MHTDGQFTPERIFEAVNHVLNQSQAHGTSDRRLEERDTVILPISIQPIDDVGQPTRSPIEGTSRNLSVGGIGFSCFQEFEEDHVLVHFIIDGQQQSPMPIKVLHRRFIGPCYEVGGQFEVTW